HPPINIVPRALVGELPPPVAAPLNVGRRAAPALRLVEAHEAVGERLLRDQLQFRIERGTDRKAAFVELLLAVALVDLAPHFLGKIFGGENVRAGRPRRDVERSFLGALPALAGGEAYPD